MKIGIFTECYHPTHNGVVISIDTFKKALEKKGHQIYVIRPVNSHDDEPQTNDIIRVPAWGLHPDYPIAATYLARKARARIINLDLDIFHFQHPFTLSRWAQKIARVQKIPTIYTYHTLITDYTHYFPGPKKFKQKIAKSISRNFCNSVDQVITPSLSMKKILESWGVKKDIAIIPTGINPDDFKKAFSRDELYNNFKIEKNKFLLLYLARIAREKNIEFLFQAIKNLSTKRQDFHLLMVGGGPQLEAYKKYVKKIGIAEIVTFTGMQKKPGVNGFFGAADLFVFPSVSETQGIVITEAMAAGTVPIAVNKMGPGDIIQNNKNGILTDLNLNEFTDKINYLLDNPTIRKSMSIAAKSRAEEFSTDVCVNKLESIYEKFNSNNPKSNTQ